MSDQVEEIPLTPEQLTEAIESLNHQPAFLVFKKWIAEVREDQIRTVCVGGTDPYRQYLETGVLQGIDRIRQIMDNEGTEQ